jgi:peptidoglycan hydrolase-like protein with peptidoglycan-binding domain
MAGGLFPILILGAGIAGFALSRKGKHPAAVANAGTFEFDPNLPPQYEAQVLGALGTVTDPRQLNSLADQMDAMGFHLTASALRHRANELEALHVGPPATPGPVPEPTPATPFHPPQPTIVPTPAPAGPIPSPGVSGLDVNMDPTTRAAVMQALASETDPAKLTGFATAIQGQYPIAAGLLLMKAAAMRAQQAVAPMGPVVPGVTPPAAGAPPAAPATVTFDASQLAPGHSIRSLMTADQWSAVLQLVNQWLEDNRADPAISFIDLSFYRDNVDDLRDEGNFGIAVDALQAHANQKGYALPPNLPGSVPGVLDGQTFLTLLLYSTAHGHPIPQVLVPVGQAVQASLAALLVLPTAAAAKPPATLPLSLPHTAPVAVPAATPPATVTWMLATNADVARDGTQARYSALLSRPVGYEETGTYNGRLWKFRVVSKTTDPTLTTFAKDVKGWIGQPTAVPLPPLLVALPSFQAPTTPALPAAPTGAIATLADVQSALNALGGAGTPLKVDGINGPKTIAAVKAFQSTHGLIVDGIALPKTKAALALALAGGPGVAVPAVPAPLVVPPISTPTAPLGAIGTLADVQNALNVLGGPGTPLKVDGINGPKTIAAVKAFQGAHGLAVDGIAGPKTKAALAQAVAAAAIPAVTSIVPAVLTVPPVATPPAVPFAIGTLADVQHALNVLGGAGTPLVVDGINGPKTIATVKAFQSAHGLTVDGVAGPKTKSALAQALAQTLSPTGT